LTHGDEACAVGGLDLLLALARYFFGFVLDLGTIESGPTSPAQMPAVGLCTVVGSVAQPVAARQLRETTATTARMASSRWFFRS
jgi:hypothetical protein